MKKPAFKEIEKSRKTKVFLIVAKRKNKDECFETSVSENVEKGKKCTKILFFYSNTVQNHKIRLLTEIEVYGNLIISKT